MGLDGRLGLSTSDTGVEFTFTVTNLGSEPVDLTFPNSQIADVAVYRNDTEIWRWSDGRMFTQAIQTETLAPDESLTHQARWENPVAGEYIAEAWLAADDSQVKVRKEFDR